MLHFFEKAVKIAAALGAPPSCYSHSI